MTDKELKDKIRVLLNKYYTMNLDANETKESKTDLIFSIAEKADKITSNWVNETRMKL